MRYGAIQIIRFFDDLFFPGEFIQRIIKTQFYKYFIIYGMNREDMLTKKLINDPPLFLYIPYFISRRDTPGVNNVSKRLYCILKQCF
jgi:hypothetical protein